MSISSREEIAFAGATASGATVKSRGFEVVLSGGIANATISGGAESLGEAVGHRGQSNCRSAAAIAGASVRMLSRARD
jgi:hypothetical protein